VGWCGEYSVTETESFLMKMNLVIDLATAADWHVWLENHYDSEREVWLTYHKAGSGQPSIGYEDSVDEALCFGWIDSIIQKIGEERYERKFTPRTDTAKWSVSNKRLVATLIREERMTELGLSKLGDASDFREDLADETPRALVIPVEVEQGLKSSLLAWETFNKLASSHKRRYIGWIMAAKRPETVQKRIAESIALLERGQTLGLK
jgi:uncharacterized protein YdeI (YjbR/CyaY-like superfamily)